MKINLEWGGGAELLFDNKKKRTIDWTSGATSSNTLKDLLSWLQHESGFLTQKPELFFSGDTVRPGIIVLINDTDWELYGQLNYELQSGDNISFISTLHGG